MKIYGIFGATASNDDSNIVMIFTTRERAEAYIRNYEIDEQWRVIVLDVFD